MREIDDIYFLIFCVKVRWTFNLLSLLFILLLSLYVILAFVLFSFHAILPHENCFGLLFFFAREQRRRMWSSESLPFYLQKSMTEFCPLMSVLVLMSWNGSKIYVVLLACPFNEILLFYFFWTNFVHVAITASSF